MATLRLLLAFVASLLAMLVAVPVVALGAPFWLVAALTRVLARRLEPPAVERWDLFEFDPGLGWRPRPNLDVYCLAKGDDVFHLVTGADGWAGTGTVEGSRIVVLGDSHAFGYGIDAEKSFARVIPALSIKALGASGYNLVQELLVLRDVSAKLSGKTVFWVVYPGNDLADNLSPGMAGYRTPFVRETGAGWEIVTKHVGPDRWKASQGRLTNHLGTLAAMFAPTYQGERAYRACDFLIENAARVCREAGARLVVTVMPVPMALDEREFRALRRAASAPDALVPDYPERRLGEICGRLGVRFLALRDELRRADFKRYDDHLTEDGHRRFASMLGRVYGEASRAVEDTLVRGPRGA